MDSMTELLIGQLLEIAAAVVISMIGAAGTLLTAKMAESKKLRNTAEAMGILGEATRTAVLRLQQTTVEWMKEANADGRLTDEEKRYLREELVRTTTATLTGPVLRTLTAGGADIREAIVNAGEAYIRMRKEEAR
ncbi:MAG: hypothetical protein ACOX17_01700 [Christensenellales bacterium]|jgi:hypothetical protein